MSGPASNDSGARTPYSDATHEMRPAEYDKLAAVEDRMWYFRALHANIERVLTPLQRGAAVLDVGCGTGGLLRRFEAAGHGWILKGVDVSGSALEYARRRDPTPQRY